MKLFRALRWAAGLTALVVVSACGGGGGGAGGGGGGSLTFDAAFSYAGFGGEAVTTVAASSVPRDVQVRVNGVIRIVQDAYIPNKILANGRVTVLSKGTRVLNAIVLNPAAGLTFSGSTVHPPISADGVLGANVITMDGVVFRTPALTWQGCSLPNGVSVLFTAADVDGDVSGSIDAAVKLPNDIGTLSGTTNFTYASPRNFNSARFVLVASNSSRIEINDAGHVEGPPAVNGTVAVPWACMRASDATLNVWPSASLIVGFRN